MPPNRTPKIRSVSVVMMITITTPRDVTIGSAFLMMGGGAT